jgi:hypothetical protein
VLTEATRLGIPIHIVQVGNEITNGMVWSKIDCKQGGGTWQPSGGDCGPDDGTKAGSNWPHLIALVNAGIRAVRVASPQTRIMIHVSDWGKAQWWLKSAYGVGIENFDILGVSYYEQFHSITSGGPVNTLRCNCSYCLTAVRDQYPTMDIIIVETAFPHEQFAGDRPPFNNNFTQVLCMRCCNNDFTALRCCQHPSAMTLLYTLRRSTQTFHLLQLGRPVTCGLCFAQSYIPSVLLRLDHTQPQVIARLIDPCIAVCYQR